MPAEVVNKVDNNRGDMSQAEFIDFLIDSHLKEEDKEHKYVSKEDILSFEQDIKKLLKSFLDFFLSYGLELSKESPKADFEELASKLQELEQGTDSGSEEKKATIKWK